MPYSARYKRGDSFDITVVYTLDNYVTIEGVIKEGTQDVHYTKSGYLLPNETLNNNGTDDIKIEPEFLLNYNQNEAQEYIEAGNPVTITIDDIQISSGSEVIYNDGTNNQTLKSYGELTQGLNMLKNNLSEYQNILYEKNSRNEDSTEIQMRISNTQNVINMIEYELEEMSAVIYYTKGAIFSNWVYGNTTLMSVLENDLIEISGQTYSSINKVEEVTYNFSNSTRNIFSTDGNTTNGIAEIAVDSSFYTHKLNVIRNSIQYNLNLAMSTYNNQTAFSNNYAMPVMQNEEWNQILTNISIVSFMQGYACGLKIYNNYMVVSSTNNEITVTPENIYYVERENFCNESTEYHKIDCPNLIEQYNADSSKTDNYISFSSKEVKYDKIKNKTQYVYDHKNLACYDCINDGNYANVDIFDNTIINYSNYANLRRAFYTGVAKERNDLYKMNAFDESQGYEILYDINANIASINSTTLPLSKIKTIEIVLGTIKTRNLKENLRYKFFINDKEIDVSRISPNSITSNQTGYTTLTINLDPNQFGDSTNNGNPITLNNIRIENNNSSSTVYLSTPDEDQSGYSTNELNEKVFKNAIQYIRIIYK